MTASPTLLPYKVYAFEYFPPLPLAGFLMRDNQGGVIILTESPTLLLYKVYAFEYYPPLPLAGVSIGINRGCRQTDSLADVATLQGLRLRVLPAASPDNRLLPGPAALQG